MGEGEKLIVGDYVALLTLSSVKLNAETEKCPNVNSNGKRWKTTAPGEKDLERHLEMFQMCIFLIISTSYT